MFNRNLPLRLAITGILIIIPVTTLATSESRLTIKEATEYSDIVAHVSAQSVSNLRVRDESCGKKYRATVYDPMKGKAARTVEFAGRYDQPDLNIGLDTIIFLIDRRKATANNLFVSFGGGDTGLNALHEKRCARAAPDYFLLLAIPYTFSRSDPADDSIHESEEDSEIRKWNDDNLMVHLPDGIDAKGLSGVRVIEFERYLINGEIATATDKNIRGLVPLQFRRSVKLAPASEIKKAVRQAAS